jgi:hypothetical protein
MQTDEALLVRVAAAEGRIEVDGEAMERGARV